MTMSVRELAERDLAITLAGDDFGWPFQVFDKQNNVWLSLDTDGNTLKGQYHRIATVKNPQTNLRTIVNRSALTVRNSTFPLPLDSEMNVKVLDINGNLVEGVLKNRASDDTIGFTTYQIEAVSSSTIPNQPIRRGIRNAD